MWTRSIAIILAINFSPAEGWEFPPELVEFEPYSKNPVFTAQGPGHWDVRIRERGWILRENENRWHLWFTGYDGRREGTKMLGYATSADGIHWHRHPKNPIVQDRWVEDVMVVLDGGKFVMFAEGQGDRAQILTSPDGVHWEWHGHLDLRKVDGSPIEKGPYGTPTAWKEDDKWYLFYERYDAGVWLATSRDLETWTNESDEPILTPGPEDYDSELIAMDQVVRHGDNYYAYYHGRGADPSTWCSCIAVSSNLRNWDKFRGNPLVPRPDNKSSPIVVQDGDRYRLYTMHDQVDLYLPPNEKPSSSRKD